MDVVVAANGVKAAQTSQQLSAKAKSVAEAVSTVVDGAKGLVADYFDPNDPNAVAEMELKAAAARIEAAAMKLAQLQPKVETLVGAFNVRED